MHRGKLNLLRMLGFSEGSQMLNSRCQAGLTLAVLSLVGPFHGGSLRLQGRTCHMTFTFCMTARAAQLATIEPHACSFASEGSALPLALWTQSKLVEQRLA